MAWYEDLFSDPLGSLGNLTDLVGITNQGDDGSRELDWRTILTLLGGTAGALGWLDSDQEKTGYQGKIPRYTGVRERVPSDNQLRLANATPAQLESLANATPEQLANLGMSVPQRRPGEYGQRYFTDMVFAQSPQNQGIPTLAQAQEQANQQALLLNKANKVHYASGGIAGIPRYYQGSTDGMADQVPATIEGTQPAALAHGEFVIPADVVSHVGNGNSDAGAKEFYNMMDRIREARTGTKKQGKQIDPKRYLPV